MEKIYWTGYSAEERTQAIHELTEIINKHGSVADFKLFSDVSMSMVIEIEEGKVNELYNDLKSHLKLDEFKPLETDSATERTILFNVTFSHGTGDLKIEVPAVPG